MGTPAAPIVIYGDFTAHHVIVTGSPPLPAGVIDFERAHLDEPAADIGYGLWRSGRPRQDASHLDLARLSLFIRGYATMARIPQQTVRALPVYLHGRGVQMIAKRVRARLGRVTSARRLPTRSWVACAGMSAQTTGEADPDGPAGILQLLVAGMHNRPGSTACRRPHSLGEHRASGGRSPRFLALPGQGAWLWAESRMHIRALLPSRARAASETIPRGNTRGKLPPVRAGQGQSQLAPASVGVRIPMAPLRRCFFELELLAGNRCLSAGCHARTPRLCARHRASRGGVAAPSRGRSGRSRNPRGGHEPSLAQPATRPLQRRPGDTPDAARQNQRSCRIRAASFVAR